MMSMRSFGQLARTALSSSVRSQTSQIGGVSFFNALVARPTTLSSTSSLWMPQQIRSMGTSWRRHKRVLRQVKGFRGRGKNCFRLAINRLHKSWRYMYRDRKVRKRQFRRLWIIRLNAAARQYGMSYTNLIPSLNKTNIQLNRKVLSDLAAHEPFAFKGIMDLLYMEKAKRDEMSDGLNTGEDDNGGMNERPEDDDEEDELVITPSEALQQVM